MDALEGALTSRADRAVAEARMGVAVQRDVSLSDLGAVYDHLCDRPGLAFEAFASCLAETVRARTSMSSPVTAGNVIALTIVG